MAIREKCPECHNIPGGWIEKAANGSRELFWVGCKTCGHLVGAISPEVAWGRWQQFIYRWKFQHAM